MNVRLLIGRTLVAGIVLLATGCGKDELVAPTNDGDNALRSAQTSGSSDDLLLNGMAKDPSGELNSATLRDGGTGEGEGEDGGGISDDGDDEADGERNKKSGN